MTSEQRIALIEEQKTAEEQRLEAIRNALSLLERARAWERYHGNLTDDLRRFFYARGITDYWIDEWELGYDPEKYYAMGDQFYTSPSLTIPIKEPVTRRILNLKHRLLNPADPHDKYRPELKGLPAALFVAELDRGLEGTVLIVEGEFKAQTTFIEADDPKLQVTGLPSKSPDLDLINKFVNAEKIIVCMDPDAYTLTTKQKEQGHRETAITRFMKDLERVAPGRGLVMRLPDKIDDLIVRRSITKRDIRYLINGARRAIL